MPLEQRKMSHKFEETVAIPLSYCTYKTIMRFLQDENDVDIDADEPHPFIALEQTKKLAIAICIAGSLSALCSAMLVAIMLRSSTGLKSTYHRLLFGLSVSDIAASLAHAFASLPAPSETSYYLWNARGSTATCSGQGALISFGWVGSSLYVACLCLYYLAVVRFNQSDRAISRLLEPMLHAVTLCYCFISVTVQLLNEQCNPVGVVCSPFSYWPPHCNGYDEGQIPEGFSIPCGRGKNVGIVTVVTIYPAVICPIVVINNRGDYPRRHAHLKNIPSSNTRITKTILGYNGEVSPLSCH